ncbi:hypothetical protein GCM10022393_41400 [Aquimarina addita]|uniref:Glycosyltransferase RgtA/B/C/D-like domain-containing protein n=1 Tax=Aquimarina addita TaxID=870485 RepID=A0ABP6UXI9_9FLAO
MTFSGIKKIPLIIYDKTNIGFVFWFLIGILITIIFYQPFEQPVISDRAYLLYMSQVVFRGDPLYNSTTFGYTPLASILVGGFMKLGTLFSLNTIESARISGILLYGGICGSVFIMSKTLFNDRRTTYIACILFCGLGYIQILSGIHAEAKLWVLLFSVLGIYFFNKEKWLWTGLIFSLAAMSWHVAVVSLFACAMVLPFRTKKFLPAFTSLMTGVFIGVLPVLLYLLFTDGWIDFWNQAIIRKLKIEGASVGESPFLWIKSGIYPHFILESLHFIFGFLGGIIAVYVLLRNRKAQINDPFSKRTVLFLLCYSVLWAIFNSLDFQTNIDLLPLIPPVIIFGTYFIKYVLDKIHQKGIIIVVSIIFITYNFFDAITYELPFVYKEQLAVIRELKEKYDRLFVIDFEEYYVLQETPMPTKFMRYTWYEDHLIDRTENGCVGIGDFLIEEQFSAVIEFNPEKRVRSKAATQLVEKIQKPFEIPYIRSNCASYLIENFTSSIPKDTIKIKNQTVLLGSAFYLYREYSLYEFQSSILHE